MLKNRWYLAVLIGFVAYYVIVVAGRATTATSPSLVGPYNIVVFYTDDQRWDTICSFTDELTDVCQAPVSTRPMGNVEVQLAPKGVVFTNAFTTNPACCPTRAAFHSGGYYSHHTNVMSNITPNGSVHNFIDTQTLATTLQQNGYKTALVGKYMNAYAELVDPVLLEGYVPPGWDLFDVSYTRPDWNSEFTFVNGSTSYDASGVGTLSTILDQYLTDFEGREGVDFINEQCPSAPCASPFFLMLSFEAPHEPATPATRHDTLYSTFEYNGRAWGEQPDGDLMDKPLYVQTEGLTWDGSAQLEFQRDQLRTLKAVDGAFKAVLQTLINKGLMSSTVIIFASDNGYMWGEHKLETKGVPYEEAIRVPLIIRAPGIATRVEDNLVAADLDLPVTILELANVLPAPSDGESLVPLLLDPNTTWRQELQFEWYVGGTESILQPPTWTAVRTTEYKYVEYVTGEKELYDLTADPYELTSQHANPNYATTLATMADLLNTMGRGVAVRTDNLPDPHKNQLPLATVNQPFEFQMEAWGGNGSYVWSVLIDSEKCTEDIPPGLTLDASGLVSGTPTTAGAWEPCIKVEDTSQSPQPGNSRPQFYIRSFNVRVVN
ncbi:MAG: sulfatase-like hydrolase/transferase [Chloroflexota bacterium]